MRRKVDDDDDFILFDLILLYNIVGNIINDFWWSGVYIFEFEWMDE